MCIREYPQDNITYILRYCNNYFSIIQQLFKNISFVSALQYLDYYYNEYPLKQTAFLYLKLPAFMSVFCYFWKDKSAYW